MWFLWMHCVICYCILVVWLHLEFILWMVFWISDGSSAWACELPLWWLWSGEYLEVRRCYSVPGLWLQNPLQEAHPSHCPVWSSLRRLWGPWQVVIVNHFKTKNLVCTKLKSSFKYWDDLSYWAVVFWWYCGNEILKLEHEFMFSSLHL